MKLRTRFIIPALLSLCAAQAQAAAENIVVNPGFEQATVGWDYEHFALGYSPLWAHSDPGMARLTYCNHANCLDTLNVGAFVGQLLPTTAGQSYDLSFCVRSFTGDSIFSVFWDGTMITKTGTPNGPMLKYTFSGLVASANANLLELHGYNSLNKGMSFDDFSVARASGAPQVGMPEPVQGQAVAEPAAYALLLAGLGAMVLVTRRRG